jgi:hypothetical protein
VATSPPPDGPPEKATEAAPPPASEPPRAGTSAWPLGYVGIIAVLLVVAAVGGGLAAGTVARPRPTVRIATPIPTVAPTPTPVATTDPSVFRQTWSGGCATDQGIWVVTNGGGLLRYNGSVWTQVDGTLRTLTRASCDAFTLYAVGPVGAVLIVDDRARQIGSFDVSLEDLAGVAALPDGVIVVGTNGEVRRLIGGQWQPYARGIEEHLNAIVMFGPLSAWTVGSEGISYRLEARGWRAIPTGSKQTLRGVAANGPANVVAVGDAGTVLRFDDRWAAIPSGVDVTLRDVIVAPAIWAVGDAGTVLTGDASGLRRVDLATTCDLRAVFARGSDIWIIGSLGGKGGAWRLRDGVVAERWGEC